MKGCVSPFQKLRDRRRPNPEASGLGAGKAMREKTFARKENQSHTDFCKIPRRAQRPNEGTEPRGKYAMDGMV